MRVIQFKLKSDKTRTTCVLILFAAFSCATGRAETPIITWHSNSVKGNESFLMIGDGFAVGKTEVRAVRLRDATAAPPTVKDLEAMSDREWTRDWTV